MGFKEVIDLDCDVATALGGKDKKSGKNNPTQVEGYFVGSKEIPDKFSKTGKGYLHIFQTAEGRLGVFGKTDLNRKVKDIVPGTMARVTFTGTVPTKMGNDMAKFKVEVDSSNTIDLALSAGATSAAAADDAGDYHDDLDEEEIVDEVPPPRATKPAKAAASPDAARQARVQALLNAGKTRA